MPSRQHAFSRDVNSKQVFYDSLESAAKLPSLPLFRYNASCMRKSRPTNGLQVGILYLTKTHLVFFAHFVSTSPTEQRICLPLRQFVHVRRAWYGRLLPHGVLVRCKGFPDYLVVLCSRDEQKKALATIQSCVADAKELASDDSVTDVDDEPVPIVSTINDDTLPEFDSSPEPELEGVQVQTMRKVRTVKFSPGQHVVEEKPYRRLLKVEKAADPAISPFSPLQGMMEKAISKAQNTVVQDRQTESMLFWFSAFVLTFITIGVCVALYLLQLRISVIASHLAVHH